MKIKIVNEDNALLLEVNADNFKKDEVVILNLNNSVKDIAIGFAEYYLTYKILAQHQNDEQKTIEEKFNEYLNTLK